MRSLNESTSKSLLERLKSSSDQAAWDRFVEIYAPLIYYWCRQHGVTGQEVADLVQEVLLLLVRRLPEFEYDPKQRFRGWLRTVTANRVRDLQRKQTGRDELPAGSRLDDLEDERVESDLFDEVEYRRFIIGRCFELMKSEFREDVWTACYMQIVENVAPSDVAQKLGISVNQVYLAKSRVLARIRMELSGLFD